LIKIRKFVEFFMEEMMVYIANESRYLGMKYNRCGRSGIKLPLISLGLWQNFGENESLANARSMVCRAFDIGITHFDLANNYGPPSGSGEETFGKILLKDLRGYRDELIISTKAGWGMWPGPYGDYGSRKYLVASLDQSLKRMGLDYVDIFYHHRPDPETPVEESMGALDFIVRSGRALYAGISSYSPEETRRAANILRGMGTPCLIHQPKYNMFHRVIEEGLLDVLDEQGMGCIVFSPLAQGILTDKYIQEIPPGSRASKTYSSLKPKDITEEKVQCVRRLDEIAKLRGQSMAQMALAWALRDPRVTSVLIGASSVSQVEACVNTQNNLGFSDEELCLIDQVLTG
jgi:L-glyceraldehyde 3-phosphate reductase